MGPEASEGDEEQRGKALPSRALGAGAGQGGGGEGSGPSVDHTEEVGGRPRRRSVPEPPGPREAVARARSHSSGAQVRAPGKGTV